MMHQVSEVPHLSVQNHRLSRIDGFPVVPQNVDYLCNAKSHIAFLKHFYTKHTNYFPSFIQYSSLYILKLIITKFSCLTLQVTSVFSITVGRKWAIARSSKSKATEAL